MCIYRLELQQIQPRNRQSKGKQQTSLVWYEVTSALPQTETAFMQATIVQYQ